MFHETLVSCVSQTAGEDERMVREEPIDRSVYIYKGIREDKVAQYLQRATFAESFVSPKQKGY